MLDFVDWSIWGTALIIVFPTLVVVLGEALYRSGDNEEAQLYRTPMAILRNGVLPLGFVAILLRKIIGFESNHIAVKIIDTALWVVALNAAVALFNGLFFSKDARFSGRHQIPKLLLDLMRMFFVLCGTAIIVSRVWGVDLSSLITALGVGSVVIGLALQDTLGSLFAGIAMVSARQIRVGDWVRFGNEEGTVLTMNWRSVTIRSRAGDSLILPNAIIARQPVTLIGAAGSCVQLAEFKFPYDVSPDRVGAMLIEAARNTTAFHPDPPPAVRVLAFDEGAIRYSMAVRTTNPQKIMIVRSDYLANVWFLAQRNGIALPGAYNTRYAIPANAEFVDPVSPSEMARRLTDVAAFRAAPPAIEQLVADARFQRFRAGETIAAQGAVAPLVFVLLHGRARAVFAAPDKSAVQLHEFERGQTLMAKAQFQGAGLPFTFKAATECEVIGVLVSDFKTFSLADAALARDIEQILSAREDAADRALAKALPEQDVSTRLGDRAQLLREMFRS